MGTGSHSKLALPNLPSRPFDPIKKSCIQENVVLATNSIPSSATLQQLIILQDWQRVLIRAKLYPKELQLWFPIEMYGITVRLLPLHLACALDPPAVVVELFLKHFVDASAMMVKPAIKSFNGSSRSDPQSKILRIHRNLRDKFRRWKNNRNGSFPVTDMEAYGPVKDDIFHEHGGSDSQFEQSTFILPSVEPTLCEDDSAYYHKFRLRQVSSNKDYEEIAENVDNNSTLSSVESALLSENDPSLDGSEDSLTKPTFILQLNDSGGLTPLMVNHSQETESTLDLSDKTEDKLFRVEWDMQPLLKEVASSGSLLPLHIACIYEASASVVDLLVSAYPLAALQGVMGMLPIHLVAAGWTLPILSEKPEISLGIPIVIETRPGPLETLWKLRQTSPESINIRSENHGLTPEEYIEECIEESDYKQLCQNAISAEQLDDEVAEASESESEEAEFNEAITSSDSEEVTKLVEACSKETLYFVDSDVSSLQSLLPGQLTFAEGLNGLLANMEWERALALVEDDPRTASRWYYGVDDQGFKTLIWKRLPIHLACHYNAPVGLIEALLHAFKDGSAMEDHLDGSLPLHMVCKHGVELEVVKSVLRSCPQATKAVDIYGRVPLHKAIIQGSPFEAVEYLVQMDPESVVLVDQSGRNPIDYAMEAEDAPVIQLLTAVLALLEQHSSL